MFQMRLLVSSETSYLNFWFLYPGDALDLAAALPTGRVIVGVQIETFSPGRNSLLNSGGH